MAYLRNHLQALVVWEALEELGLVLVLVLGVDEVYNLGSLFHPSLHAW
jgi:hypothetical protein